MTGVAARVRARLLDGHRETVAAAIGAADAVAGTWDGNATTDRDALVRALRRELGSAGVLDRCPAIIAAAADAAGFALRSEPVAAPPYVTVTSTGPVLRATADPGRLVVALRTFAVERGDPARYRRSGDDPEEVLEVEFRRSG